MLPERALGQLTTPVCAYVYDTAVLRATAATLRAALPAGATLLYAVKANGHPAVVQALADACDGLEVASGGELELAVLDEFHLSPSTTGGRILWLHRGKSLDEEWTVHEIDRLPTLAIARMCARGAC